MKVFERAIRRANIPIAMSKGFNPHPKLSMPLALSVGIIGRDEVLELELLKVVPSEILVELLIQQLPKEIHILSVETIPYSVKAQVCDVIYEVIFKDIHLLKELKINEILQKPSIIVNRSKNGHLKPFNIRPSIEEIIVKPTGLILSLRMTSKGIARPEEVLDAVCGTGKKEFFEIIRTKVNLSSAN